MRHHPVSSAARLANVTSVALLLLFAGAAHARPSARITDVLLYPGGATIVRTVNVSPGMKQAEITGLPTGFDVQTLRTEASEGIRVGEISSSDSAGEHAVNPAEAGLEAKLTALRDRKDALDAEEKSYQLVVDYLGRLMMLSPLSPDAGSDAAGRDAHRRAPALDPKMLLALANGLRTQAGQLLAHLHDISVQKREIDKSIDALRRDVEKLRTNITDTRTLTVNLKAARAGTLRISYEVGNAGWKPAYRATLNPETSRVEIERRAIITQRTGEDWTDVHLTLSTAQPRRATSSADPQPWLVAQQPLYPPVMAAQPVAAAEGRMKRKREAVADAAAPASAPVAEYVPPTLETQSMFANQYEVPEETSLPADGREVSVELTRQEFAVKQYFQAVPRRELAVYVTADADMPTGDWPAGNIQLFRGGSYVGSSFWNPQAKERFVMGFGRDEQVQVSVSPLKTDSSSTGFIAKHRLQKIATLFTFVNRHQRPVELKVLEAAPVSTTDEIKVETAFSPKPDHENWEDKRGVVEWQVKLAAKATSKIKTDYVIDYPN